ncbi:MAG: right-handed parallel beta-helix repeat-containing protein [Pseudomonadota bacterium]
MLRKIIFVLTLLLFATLSTVLALAYFVEHFNRTPRELAPYIEHRSAGHNATIVSLGNWVGKTLRSVDRMEPLVAALPALKLGAQPLDLSQPVGNIILVTSADQARVAIANANPGDVITFSPGAYQFSGTDIFVNRAGRDDARIIVRAEVPGTVKLQFSLLEGFHVTAPYWSFENLHIQGVCEVPGNCEHAFHVVANAHHFLARNNTIVDFNAHFKVNMSNQQIPDDGVIEYNSISNTDARRTESSVTSLDLVAVSRWRIEHNLITDFIKAGSDKVSYGVFVKGGGNENRIANNLIICEHHLRREMGQRVGLSFGGGGTGKAFCPDHQCVTEQDRGVIESNLVMACSDDGIYLNKAASSRIIKNTLIDTGGIEVRFAESTADVEGNLVDGKIRSRDGGLIRASENIDTNMLSLFAGYHPVRNMFNDASMMDLRWRQRPPVKSSSTLGSNGTGELCDSKKSAKVIGAFDDFNACLLSEPKKPN